MKDLKTTVLLEILKGDLDKALSTLNTVSSESQHFKIGKTGTAVEERRNQDDYRKEYPYIEELYTTKEESYASFMESKLIDSYINYPNNDNEKNGAASEGDKMSNDDGIYRVYVVWK